MNENGSAQLEQGLEPTPYWYGQREAVHGGRPADIPPHHLAREHVPTPPGGGRTTLFGLRRTTFLLTLAVAVAVAAAAIIGGVLGAQLASQCSEGSSTSLAATATTAPTQSDSNTDTSTATTTVRQVCPTGVTVKLDCPEGTQRGTWTPDDRVYHYDVTCDSDCSGNDIMQVWAHSIAQCMHACESYNVAMALETNPLCIGIAFRADMADAAEFGGNCFLKRECSVIQTQAELIAHAVFVYPLVDSESPTR